VSGDSSSLLDESVSDGGRQMLAAALSAKVAAHIDGLRHVVDGNGHRLVVRNGYCAEREVMTAAGAGASAPARQSRMTARPGFCAQI
jgi:hypothetical protein